MRHRLIVCSPLAARVARLGTFVLMATAVVIGVKASAAEPARLQDTAYHVELVIFRSLTPLGIAEDWSVEGLKGRPAATPATEEDDGAAAESGVGNRLAVSSLSPALFKLAAVESSLQRSRGYQVLGHIGWTQLAVPRGSGLAADLSEVGLSGLPVRGTRGPGARQVPLPAPESCVLARRSARLTRRDGTERRHGDVFPQPGAARAALRASLLRSPRFRRDRHDFAGLVGFRSLPRQRDCAPRPLRS